MTAAARRRVLFLLPFPPDPNGAHGAARMTGQLLDSLAATHDVAAIYLRSRAEPPIDRALAERLALAVEVERPPHQGPGRARRTGRRVLGLVAGRPLWATDWAVPQFGARLREIARDWHPDLVLSLIHI